MKWFLAVLVAAQSCNVLGQAVNFAVADDKILPLVALAVAIAVWAPVTAYAILVFREDR